MSFVRLDDQIAHHPKILRAGAEAAWLWACAIAYCNRQLTDGYVTAAALMTMGTFRTPPKRLAAVLVEAGLFEVDGAGYRVHDYLAHNPDRVTIHQRIRDASDRKSRSRARVSPMSQRDTTVTGASVTPMSHETPASSRAYVPTPTPTPTPFVSDETTPAPRLVSSSATAGGLGPEHLACQELAASWNRIRPAPGVTFSELQPASKRLLRDALRAKSLDAWERIFQRIDASDYLSGRADMPPVSLFRVLELGDRIDAGQYDNRTEKPPAAAASAITDEGMARAAAAMLAAQQAKRRGGR